MAGPPYKPSRRAPTLRGSLSGQHQRVLMLSGCPRAPLLAQYGREKGELLPRAARVQGY